MKVFREQVVKVAVIICVFALLFTFVSFLDTQWSTNTSWNVDQRDLSPMGVSSRGLDYDDRADRVDITISYTTDGEFDVWLVDDAVWNMSSAFSGPGPWLRHGIASNEDIEWSISADEFEGELRLVEENSFYGERGSLFNGTTVNFDWRITTRSVVDPMKSPVTYLALAILVLAVLVLAWAMFLPREGVRDFDELYPDFPNSLSTDESEPRGT